MKRVLCAVLSAGLCCASLSAIAADADYNWTGPYAGVQAGFVHTSLDSFDSATGLTVGGFGGYNYLVTPQFVVGGDVFFDWNQKRDHDISIGGFSGSASVGTNTYGIDALFGIPVGAGGSHLLPYLKIGYGWASGTGDLSGDANSFRFGLGVEWRLNDMNGLTLQAMHQDFGSDNDGLTNNNITVGYTWHFD